MTHSKNADGDHGGPNSNKPSPLDSDESALGEEDPGSALDVQETTAPPHHDGAHPEEDERTSRR